MSQRKITERTVMLDSDVESNDLLSIVDVSENSSGSKAIETSVFAAYVAGLYPAPEPTDPVTSTGGNGANDEGVIVEFGAEGSLTASSKITVVDGSDVIILSSQGLASNKNSSSVSLLFPAHTTSFNYTLPDFGGQVLLSYIGTILSEGVDIVPFFRGGTTIGKIITWDDQIALAHVSPDGEYTVGDGGFVAGAGFVEIHGSISRIISLAEVDAASKQVYVTSDGTLYGVDPPKSIWTKSDTDSTLTPLPNNGNPSDWVEFPGLRINITATEVTSVGDRIDATITLYLENDTNNRDGYVRIGVGLNGLEPTSPGIVVAVGRDVKGNFVVSATIDDVELLDGDYLTVWASVSSSNNNDFTVSADGTVSPHKFLVSGVQSQSQAQSNVSSNTNSSISGGVYYVDASSGPIEITLSSIPSMDGEWIFVIKDGANAVTLMRNGKSIHGEPENFELNHLDVAILIVDENGDYWIK